ncbi:hypothetical protein [Pandoraea apista]|uniref:hypothetical protein n=1 Tax=Pandoraea apista TaxID=93218 RepID=UPI00248DF71C|nr:hypothetical protein [Pandoraea apista]
MSHEKKFPPPAKLDTSDLENPFLSSLPASPANVSEAMNILGDHSGEMYSLDNAPYSQEHLLARTDNVYCATSVDGQILMRVMAAIRDSYRERDLRRNAFLEIAYRANRTLHERNAVHPRHLVTLEQARTVNRASGDTDDIRVPNSRPRGLIVSAPLRMGRRTLAGLIENFIGVEYRPLIIRLPNGNLQCIQLKVVRVNWPLDGTLRSFALEFAEAIDRLTDGQSKYSRMFHHSMQSSGGLEVAMRCLALSANVGAVLVERINIAQASTAESRQTWDALARLTRKTGIPVISFATPGAVLQGLGNCIDAFSDLTTLGVHELLPATAPSSPHWTQLCRAHYDATLAPIADNEMPEWLAPLLHELTLGRKGLVAMIMNHIGMTLLEFSLRSLEETHFRKYAQAAIEHYAPALEAVDLVAKRAPVTPSSLRRFGDMFTSKQATLLRVRPLLDI